MQKHSLNVLFCMVFLFVGGATREAFSSNSALLDGETVVVPLKTHEKIRGTLVGYDVNTSVALIQTQATLVEVHASLMEDGVFDQLADVKTSPIDMRKLKSIPFGDPVKLLTGPSVDSDRLEQRNRPFVQALQNRPKPFYRSAYHARPLQSSNSVTEEDYYTNGIMNKRDIADPKYTNVLSLVDVEDASMPEAKIHIFFPSSLYSQLEKFSPSFILKLKEENKEENKQEGFNQPKVEENP
jgi:small nuclear ribonucleoprotein (snRNP)-like protein